MFLFVVTNNYFIEKTIMKILPRTIRLRDAPDYLGMDKNRFNTEVRPSLVEVPIGIQGVGFDRLDLDAWFDEYKARNGYHACRRNVWEEREPQVSSNAATLGTQTKRSTELEFAKALALSGLKKRKNT
jgi:hypothetical protein